LPGQEKVDVLPVIKAFFTFLLTFILLYFTITTLFASWATENKKIEP